MEAPLAVRNWIAELQSVLQPAHVHGCDGSDAEREALEREAVASGVLQPLAASLPGGSLHRSRTDDVART